MPEELSRNCFDVILQHDWSSEQFLLHIRVFFGGKTKSPCFVLSIHWLIKQITNTYGHHFSRSYENRSITSLIKALSNYLENIAKWCTENKMYINTENTKALLVTGNRLQHKLRVEKASSQICLNATNINQILHHKLLV